jgi:hypothetical protein
VLARTSTLEHPFGIEIPTPILIPSFSSKGFGFDSKGRSEMQRVFETASEFLTDALLLSAYDVYYKHVDPPTSAITEITFVDSGGYETSDLLDLSETFVTQLSSNEWDQSKLAEVHASWPEHVPAVFISYDSQSKRLSLSEQINAATRLFAGAGTHLTALLIKPETTDARYIDIHSIVAGARALKAFDVIGLTEKELGNSFATRMENIAKLRVALDDEHIAAPIHIFGSLDPISVCLYFVAGAEIFDGLTWLKYGYLSGSAVYRHNFAALTIGIHRRDDFVKLKTLQDNLNYLSNLRIQMMRFLNDADFAQLGAIGDVVRQGYELLRSKNPRYK